MLCVTRGDIFSSGAEALVNPVNCVGVSGRGLAAAFKQRYPENFAIYKEACDRGTLRPGGLVMTNLARESGDDGPRFIVNLPTKDHWRSSSRLSYIEEGLESLVAVIMIHGIRSVALPALGCGLGKLSWDDVHELMMQAFEPLPDVEVTVFEPLGSAVGMTAGDGEEWL